MCRFDAVVHFAGRKAVGESVEFPMLYYTHNIVGAVNLIEAMRKHGVRNVRLILPNDSCGGNRVVPIHLCVMPHADKV